MSNVLLFPKLKINSPIRVNTPYSKIKGVLSGFIKLLWAVSVITWPVSKWFIRLDLLFVFLKMVFHSPSFSFYYLALHLGFAVSFIYFIRVFNRVVSLEFSSPIYHPFCETESSG